MEDRSEGGTLQSSNHISTKLNISSIFSEFYSPSKFIGRIIRGDIFQIFLKEGWVGAVYIVSVHGYFPLMIMDTLVPIFMNENCYRTELLAVFTVYWFYRFDPINI